MNSTTSSDDDSRAAGGATPLPGQRDNLSLAVGRDGAVVVVPVRGRLDLLGSELLEGLVTDLLDGRRNMQMGVDMANADVEPEAHPSLLTAAPTRHCDVAHISDIFQGTDAFLGQILADKSSAAAPFSIEAPRVRANSADREGALIALEVAAAHLAFAVEDTAPPHWRRVAVCDHREVTVGELVADAVQEGIHHLHDLRRALDVARLDRGDAGTTALGGVPDRRVESGSALIPTFGPGRDEPKAVPAGVHSTETWPRARRSEPIRP